MAYGGCTWLCAASITDVTSYLVRSDLARMMWDRFNLHRRSWRRASRYLGSPVLRVGGLLDPVGYWDLRVCVELGNQILIAYEARARDENRIKEVGFW